MFVEVDDHQEQIWKGTSEVFQDLHHFTLKMLKWLLQVWDQENTFQEPVFQRQEFQEQVFQEKYSKKI